MTTRITSYNVCYTKLLRWIATDQELIEGIDKLIESYECHWNGGNYVGRYDEDIERVLDYYIGENAPTFEFGGLSTPGGWFGNVMTWAKDDTSVTIEGYTPITANTTDDELSAMAQEMIADADCDGEVVFDGDVRHFLETLRDDCE